MKNLIFALLCVGLFAGMVCAQEMITIPRTEYDAIRTRIAEMEKELQALKSELAAIAPEGDTGELPLAVEPQPLVIGGGSQTGVVQTLLPDISIVGNMVGLVSSDRDDPDDRSITPREIEIGIQGYLYPQIRADVFIAMEEDHDFEAELEEAYVSFLQIGNTDFSSKVGKMRLDFGKINRVHPHHWNYVNAPLPIHNFMGDHGLIGQGASVGYLLPTGGNFFAQLDVGTWRMSGHSHHHHCHHHDHDHNGHHHNGNVHNGHDHNGHHHNGNGHNGHDYNGHDHDNDHDHNGNGEFEGCPGFEDRFHTARLWTSTALGNGGELELGLSGARGKGHECEIHGRDNITLLGLDLTYRNWPGAHQRVLLQGELFNHRQGGNSKLGYYAFGNYKMNNYWDFGLLYDWSQRPNEFEGHDSGLSAIVTNRLTESTALRLQLTRGSEAGEGAFSQAMLQMIWGIGPHSHPLE